VRPIHRPPHHRPMSAYGN